MTNLLLQYPGSKWRLGKQYVRYFPAHRTYVDACAGTAALFARKQRSTIEIYNDIDANLFNMFQVLQDAASYEELLRLFENTLMPGGSMKPVNASWLTPRKQMSEGPGHSSPARPSGFPGIPPSKMPGSVRGTGSINC